MKTTSDDLFDAALRRVGVVRVDRMEDLFHLADALSKQPTPKGPRLTTVSNAPSPGGSSSQPFLQAVENAGREPANDGLLLSVVPQAISDPLDAVEARGRIARSKNGGCGSIVSRRFERLTANAEA